MRTDPILAVPGTDQSSESFIWVEVKPLRRACHLKVILSSHLQRITSLHVHGDRHYIYVFSFYSLFFQLQYHAISFVHTFLCILPCRIFSCELCVIEGFHVWEYPETISCLWSLIKMLIFLFCWFVSFSWLHYAACRFLGPNGDETCMDPVLSAREGQNPDHWTIREVPDSDKFE